MGVFLCLKIERSQINNKHNQSQSSLKSNRSRIKINKHQIPNCIKITQKRISKKKKSSVLRDFTNKTINTGKS